MIFATAIIAASLATQPTEAREPQRAFANLSQYFSRRDYPESAVARRAEGTVGFRLEINAAGRVTDCRVTSSSEDEALDAATCTILTDRARYMPARDASGRSVPGTDEGRVTWRLPAPAPPSPKPFAPMRSVSILRSDGASTLACTVAINGEPQRSGEPDRCGSIGTSDVAVMLRQAQRPMELAVVSVVAPASAGLDAARPDEAGLGTLQSDLVTEYDVSPDGRIAGCRTIRRVIGEAAQVPTQEEQCALVRADWPPMFEASAGTEMRVARVRLAVYLKGEGFAHLMVRHRRPRGSLNQYFSSDDYPAAALGLGRKAPPISGSASAPRGE